MVAHHAGAGIPSVLVLRNHRVHEWVTLVFHTLMQLLNAISEIEHLDGRLMQIRKVVQNLPTANYDLLKRISEHLEKYIPCYSKVPQFLNHFRVNDYEDRNNMTADALAIVFSPNLLRAPHNDFVMILANMGHTHKLVHALITHVCCQRLYIFNMPAKPLL